MTPIRTLAKTSSVLIALLATVSCDAARKFIDPTGKAYNVPPDTSKPPEAPKAADAAKPGAPPPPPAPTPAGGNAGPAPATYRDAPPLTASTAMQRAQDMLMTTPQGWVEFHNGRAFAKGRQLTLRDGNESPWGLGIVDLDQDGADDAIFAVRSTSSRDTSWTLAVLLDRAGKLQCIQTIPLSSVDRIRSLEATQGGVLVVPETGSPQLFGWVGGELVGNP